MPNVQVQNYPVAISNDKSQVIWQLTRAMKTAGYRYKASSDGTTKDSTANPANDKWGGGVQVGSQTATGVFNISNPSTAAAGGRVTLTGLSGMTPASVGHFITITGATNVNNNGTFLITAYISATSVQVDSNLMVLETTPGGATWTEKSALLDAYPAIGAGGWWCAQGPSTIKIPIGTALPVGTFIKGENITSSPHLAQGEIIGVYTDTVNGGYLVVCPRVSGVGGGPRGWGNTDTFTGSISGATVTGTGTILEYVREIVFWKDTAALGHIYYQCIESVTEGTTTATTGRFSTMAALSTCTATICPGGAALSAVVATGTTPPAVTLTGTAPFLTTSTIEIDITTGGARGTALFTWKLNGVVQQTGQTTAATFVLGATGITANFPVGTYTNDNVYTSANNPTVNAFPLVGSYVAGMGRAETGNVVTGAADMLNNSNSLAFGLSTLLVANAIEDTNISADGSITCVGGIPGSGSTQFMGWGFLRLDDTEDGDVEPYAWLMSNFPSSAYNRNKFGTVGSQTMSSNDAFGANVTVGAVSSFLTFQRRGFPTNDLFTEAGWFTVGSIASTQLANITPASPDRVACAIGNIAVREPIWVIVTNNAVSAFGTQSKMRKGTVRWWSVVMGGNGTDTYDSKKFIQLSSSQPAVVVGPADGATSPLNQ